MMKHLFVALSILTSVSANAEETKLSVSSRNDLSIAIYNENLALVNDIRTTPLKKGINNIAFLDVSAQLRPETALVKGSGFFVKEQNFNFDLLTYTTLLEKSVGEKVMLEHINPGNGERKVEYGEVISNAQGSLVLKVGDRIETNYPGRVIFLDIPETLRAKPTLVLSLDAKEEGSRPVALSYLTGGLSWKVDYVAEINKDETELDVNGLVTLTNTSGVDYTNVSLQLVAGNVNQVQPIMYKSMRNAAPMAKMEMAYADTGAGFAREGFMDFYLYTLPEKININNKQTKQISMIGGNIKVKKEYIYRNLFNIYNNKNFAGDFEKVKPAVELKFNNSEKEGLGIPMPAGIFRIYKADSNSNMLFAGEDSINHTPVNEEVSIKLGDAFDITAKGKRISFKSLGSKSFEAEYEMTIKNPKDTAIETAIYQYTPNNMQILSESVKSTKENSNELLWKVNVPAKGETTLRAKVRVEID